MEETSAPAFLERRTSVGTSVASRMRLALSRQRELSPICPAMPRLDGSLALVTGGNAGIGKAIGDGLAARGAEVVIAARGDALAREVVAGMFSTHGVAAHALRLDLSDLSGVASFIDTLARLLAGRKIAHLVQNAGVWPQSYARSAQGHEIAFATNVLGHFALTLGLMEAGLLADSSRVVVQTGDIYIMAKDCTPDFSYRGAWGGMLAYCRSKLGNLWFARELQRRHPALEVVVAHPGVVASGLVKTDNRVTEYLRRAILLDPTAGAQTALTLATQPGLREAVYYHNTGGRMLLSAQDPALDATKAAALWDTLSVLRGSV